VETPRNTRRWAGLAACSALALALTGVSLAASAAPASTGVDPNSDAATAATGVDASSAIVQLSGSPLSVSAAVDRRSNKQVDTAGAKTQGVRAALAQERKALKTWLRTNAPKVKVTGEYDHALNAVAVRLNGTSIDTLRSAPGVKSVGYQSTYVTSAHEDPDLARIDGAQGWAAAGATSVDGNPSTWAGFGIQVGIVDTGIDVNHPCFDDTGFPATPQQGPASLTNNKVIVAKVFNNKSGSRASRRRT
jgi:hypothetical protein